MLSLRAFILGVSLALSTGLQSAAQQIDPVPQTAAAETQEINPFQKLVESIDWKKEGQGALGNIATIEVPSGYAFTGSAGTIKLMEAYGN